MYIALTAEQRVTAMNEQKKGLAKQIIQLLKDSDKETVIKLLETMIAGDEPLTLKDAYDAVYGSAIGQIIGEG